MDRLQNSKTFSTQLKLLTMPSSKTGKPWVVALIATCALRLVYSILGALIAPHLKLDPALVRSNDFTERLMTPDGGWPYRLLGVWERFDTLWYIHIAAHGYDRPEAVVFFPLYPLLIRILSPLLQSPLAASLLISTISVFFLVWGFQKLIELDLPGETVRRALILFAVWPSSFILFAGYPESLLIALMIWSVYFARRERWLRAGLLGLLAGLTKAVGVCVVIPLIVIAWREKSWKALPAAICLLSLPIVKAAINFSGHQFASGAYPKYWKTEVAFPWTTFFAAIRESFTTLDALLILNLTALGVIFIPAFIKRLRLEYTLFTLATLVLFLTKKTDPLLQSASRYSMEVFPAFASLAAILKHPFLFALSLFLMALLNLILLWSFFNWALVV
jgi:Gpi18-like mannosyltransferase